jgi:hypothetical protein
VARRIIRAAFCASTEAASNHNCLHGNSLYWHTMSELFVKQELLKTLPTLDAVLLDIDGVILDVAQTFRVVASEVTQWYAVNI